MKIDKEHNQNYGRYMERAIDDLSNNRPICNHENFNFSDEEIKEMNSDARILTDYIGGKDVKYIGNHTGKANGDLIVDGEIVEIKYTGGSSGTYLNASMTYLELLGMPPYSVFLRLAGYYTELEKLGIPVNYNNK